MTGGQEISLADEAKKKQEARRKLWERGNLSWKFEERPWAREMYDFTRARWGASPYIFWLVHRRGAKTTTGIIIALEECLRAANIRCAIICKTKDQAQEICDVSMVELLEDCPKSVEPRKIKNDYAYVFDHNGSRLQILSLDGKNNAAKIRGRKFRFILLSEVGFIENVDKFLRASILPTLNDALGATTGMLVLDSTPPEEAGHPMQTMVRAAELDDRLFFLPLSKNKHASPKFVEKAKTDCGGADSTDYRREYELEFVVDDERTAVPEATTERLTKGAFALVSPDKLHRVSCDANGRIIRGAGEDDAPDLPADANTEGWTVEQTHPPIVRELVYPAECDHYESLDPGGSDLTGWLGSTYIFEQDLIYIEDEITFLNMTTDAFAAKVRLRETALWGAAPKGKIRRYADNSNKRFLYDLFVNHKLNFTPTAKDNKVSQINTLRVLFRDGRIAIHPRCKLLILTLSTAKLAKDAKRGFDRGEEIGHADLLDCLLYKIRNVSRRALPASPSQQRAAEMGIRPPPPPASAPEMQLARAMGLGRFRR